MNRPIILLYKKGETLRDFYLRFSLLLNDMNIYNMKLEQFQVNTKFLNTLPPEWSKFVTDVKLVRDLHTTNVDQLHAYLGQHEYHANEVRLMHERNSDPLALVATQQMTQSPYQNHQNLFQNTQFQPQVSSFQSPQYGSPYQSQQYSTHQSSTPLSITYPSNEYQSSIHHNVYSPSSSIPQLEYAPLVNQQSEFSQPETGLIVPVFQKGDDPIDAINHMKHRRRQTSFSMGTSRTYTLGASGSNSRKQRTITCYNCKGEGHMSNQCTKPKRKRDDSWFKEQVLLVEAQAHGQILNEEELAFLADPGIPEDALAEYVEISDLNASLQEKALAITALKDELRKLKGKALVDNNVSNHPSDPELHQVNVEPITPKLLNKRTTHSAYIKHSQEEAEVLKELVDHTKANYPLDPLLESALKQSTSASGSQPSGNTKKDKIQQTQSRILKNKVEAHPRKVKSSLKNKDHVVEPKGTAPVQHSKLNANSDLQCVKCNGCMLSDNHDLYVLDFINNVNARAKSRFVKKNSKRKVWKPTGKVFTNIGYIWRPTSRTFTIVENVCPLTRITTTTEVPLRESSALDNKTPKLVITLVYSRKPRKSKTSVPVNYYKVVQIVLWYLDSGCSKHMTGDRSQLTNFVSKFLGTVKFGNDHVAKIMGYGDYQIGNVTNLRVYFVKGLGHNLFSVGQFCDSNLEASKTKSWLWHRRLSHLNFRAINHLAGHGLVRGLPKLKFEKDHLCSACVVGKSTKKPHKPKSEDTNQEKLYLVHMDLYGPMRVASVNGKKYIFVIVDDYSRFTWVKCLRSKDEAPVFIINFLKMIQVFSLAIHPRRKHSGFSTDVPDGIVEPFTVDFDKQTAMLLNIESGPILLEMNPANNQLYPYFGVPILEIPSDQSSSSDSIHTIVHPDHQISKHNSKWTKDHPLENIIGELARPVSTRLQLHEQALFCYYDAFLTAVEPKTYKDALTQACWIEAMQEELNEFERLEVWELVPRPDKVMVITLKWIYKVKLDELGGILKNKARLVARGYRQEEGILILNRVLFAPVGFVDKETHQVYKLRKALYRLKHALRGGMDVDLRSDIPSTYQKAHWISIIIHLQSGKDLLWYKFFAPLEAFLFNQSKYALESLKKYGFDSCDPMDTLMVEKSKLDEDKEGKAVDPSHYRGMIGPSFILQPVDLTYNLLYACVPVYARLRKALKCAFARCGSCLVVKGYTPLALLGSMQLLGEDLLAGV
ncbi:retrovirus-related pol polyprotein from transposon TNT 1-94 [Tanacetum coccineum]